MPSAGVVAAAAHLPFITRAERYISTTFRHWYRGDTGTLNAGNFASLTNKGTGGGSINLGTGSPNTVAAPSNDARFANKPVVKLTGTQWLDSSFAASEWSILHSGAGCYLWLACAYDTDTADLDRLLMTITANTGFTLTRNQIYNPSVTVLNAAGSAVFNLVDVGTDTATNRFFYEYSFATASTPDASLIRNGTTISTANAGAVPAATDPGMTLRIGASSSGTQSWIGSVAELIVHFGTPTADEINLVRRYQAQRYG
jgi:hypothetical protein